MPRLDKKYKLEDVAVSYSKWWYFGWVAVVSFGIFYVASYYDSKSVSDSFKNFYNTISTEGSSSSGAKLLTRNPEKQTTLVWKESYHTDMLMKKVNKKAQKSIAHVQKSLRKNAAKPLKITTTKPLTTASTFTTKQPKITNPRTPMLSNHFLRKCSVNFFVV